VSNAQDRTKRIRDKIEASQARLEREGADLPALPRKEPLPDAYPPEDYRSLALEYPWLTVAAGLGVGLLAGALLPKKAGSKMAGRALALASVAGELAIAYGSQAREAASESAREGLAKVSEKTAPARARAARAAGSARSNMRSAGLVVAREAIKLAAKARK